MPDIRVAFIAECVASLGGKDGADRQGISNTVAASEAVKAFLDDPATILLLATLSDSGSLLLTNSLHKGGAGRGVHFIKTRPEAVTDDNLRRIVQVI
jgi:hypothetical protein